MKAMLTVLSLGAGVQSSTLALMAAHGEVSPMPDCAIFADTQHEPAEVYRHLEWLVAALPYPVYTVTAGDLWRSATRVRTKKDGTETYISTGIPVFLAEGLRLGIGKRQCTRDFKIYPVTRKCRELLGLRRVLPKHGVLVEMWMGISADEADRQKPAQAKWIEARWPLLEMDMDRQDCLNWMAAHGYPRPPRSACTFCPFRDDDSWLALSPPEFAATVEKEAELQAAYAKSSKMRGTPYLHDSRKPLGEVTLTPSLHGRAPRQLNMFRNECAGLCGV